MLRWLSIVLILNGEVNGNEVVEGTDVSLEAVEPNSVSSGVFEAICLLSEDLDFFDGEGEAGCGDFPILGLSLTKIWGSFVVFVVLEIVPLPNERPSRAGQARNGRLSIFKGCLQFHVGKGEPSQQIYLLAMCSTNDIPSLKWVRKRTFALENMPSFRETIMN